MKLDLKSAISDLLAEKCGRQSSEITATSKLLQDLGLDGDDAAELMKAFADQFKVDMRDFKFMQYFRSEPNLFSILRLPSARARELYGKIPITVLDMAKAAEAHRWIPPHTRK